MGNFDFRKGFVTGTLFLSLTGIVTGLVPNPVYVRMVPITFLDFFFLVTTSVFAGYYFGKEECSVFDGRLAGIGGITGFLSFGCPVCNFILLAFFSTSTIMAYLDPLRPFLGLFSTLVFTFLIMKNRRV